VPPFELPLDPFGPDADGIENASQGNKVDC
jgi:hypothetical protein